MDRRQLIARRGHVTRRGDGGYTKPLSCTVSLGEPAPLERACSLTANTLEKREIVKERRKNKTEEEE